jgi:arylformamidase
VTGIDLEAEYNARAAVPDHPAILARWAEASATLRRQLPGHHDLAYGDDPGERLDWFPKPSAGPRPALFFVHGGYWRTLDKDDFTFLIPMLHGLGFDAVLVNYALCPRVTVDDIVAQVRLGLAWTVGHAAAYGADGARVYLAGHSAGGHLVAMLMATDWAAAGHEEVAAALRGGLAVSGLYELEPLRHTSINVEARLDAAAAARLSPALLRPTVDAPLTLAVGAYESAEFHRQSAALASAWPNCVAPDSVPSANHFTVVESLLDPESVPVRLLEQLVS